MLHGFVMFVIGGEEKVLRIDQAVTPDLIGVALLDMLREWSVILPEDARRLRVVDPASAGSGDREALRRLGVRLQMEPVKAAWHALKLGVAPAGGVDLTTSRDITWGYVLDLDHWGFEVYEGWQVTRHVEGRFPERASSHTSYPPRLVALWGLGDAAVADEALPSDEEFLRKVAEGARTMDCPWLARR